MFFQDPHLNNFMHKSNSIENISFSKILILKQQNAKNVTDDSLWVKLISKNSNTLEIEHSLLNSPIISPRYGFHFKSTDLAEKKPFIGLRVTM